MIGKYIFNVYEKLLYKVVEERDLTYVATLLDGTIHKYSMHKENINIFFIQYYDAVLLLRDKIKTYYIIKGISLNTKLETYQVELERINGELEIIDLDIFCRNFIKFDD